MVVITEVEILNKSLERIAVLKSFVPLNKDGTILTYSKELSDYGRCRFRVSAFDSMFNTYGDILVPHQYHVRLVRGGITVWQGAIIDNPIRNKSFIEVIAVEYEFYLDKKLIHRTSADINGTANIYRTFNSGTMAAAVTAFMGETIADYAASTHILSALTLGTIENPNYPPGMTNDFDGNVLSGAWQFGAGTSTAKGPTLQFDFHSILYVLKAFGIYSYADFRITNDLTFEFKGFLGNNLLQSLVFTYGTQGNIVDYNLPRKGERQVNNLIAIATDPNGVILHANQVDSTSTGTYGLMEGVAAYSDVKSQGTLNARAAAELPIIATPDETNAIIYLDEKGYPLGTYDVGDLVTLKIVNKGVNFDQVRRIVGLTVVLNETGREMIALQTNTPRPWEYGDGQP